MSKGSSVRIEPPLLSVTMDEAQLYHMIRDHELTEMAAPGTGILGSVGFTALGAALGLTQPFVAAIQKLGARPTQTLEVSDFVASLEFIACLVLSIVCLFMFTIQSRGKKTLAERIRSRPTVTPGAIGDPKVIGIPLSSINQQR